MVTLQGQKLSVSLAVFSLQTGAKDYYVPANKLGEFLFCFEAIFKEILT